jgi:hypothetical protein
MGLQMGDAMAMLGQPEEAADWYERTALLQSPYSRSLLAMLKLRTLLATEPEIVAAINDVGGRQTARRVLAVSESPSARIMGALAAAVDDESGEALAILLQTAGTNEAERVGARWLAWAASFAYRAGQYGEAERFRTLAVQAAHSENDIYEVERLEAFARRIAWASTTTGTITE